MPCPAGRKRALPCPAPSHAMRLLMRPCGCLSKLAEDELDEAEIPGFDSAALVGAHARLPLPLCTGEPPGMHGRGGC